MTYSITHKGWPDWAWFNNICHPHNSFVEIYNALQIHEILYSAEVHQGKSAWYWLYTFTFKSEDHYLATLLRY